MDPKKKTKNLLDEINEEIKEEEQGSEGSVSDDDDVPSKDNLSGALGPNTTNRHHQHAYAKKHGSSENIAIGNMTTDDSKNTSIDTINSKKGDVEMEQA